MSVHHHRTTLALTSLALHRFSFFLELSSLKRLMYDDYSKGYLRLVITMMTVEMDGDGGVVEMWCSFTLNFFFFSFFLELFFFVELFEAFDV